MELVDLEIIRMLRMPLMLEGGSFLRVRRLVGALALMAGALALLIHGPGLLI